MSILSVSGANCCVKRRPRRQCLLEFDKRTSFRYTVPNIHRELLMAEAPDWAPLRVYGDDPIRRYLMLEFSRKSNTLEQSEYRYTLQDVQDPHLYRMLYTYSEVPRIPFNHRHVPMRPPDEIFITDTTFRDGQQARAPYTVEQIVQLYKFMHELGGPKGIIRQSEFFLYSEKDRQAVDACRDLGYRFPEITGWIDRPPLYHSAPVGRHRAEGTAFFRKGAAKDHPRIYPGGRGAQPGAGGVQHLPQGRAACGRGEAHLQDRSAHNRS